MNEHCCVLLRYGAMPACANEQDVRLSAQFYRPVMMTVNSSQAGRARARLFLEVIDLRSNHHFQPRPSLRPTLLCDATRNLIPTRAERRCRPDDQSEQIVDTVRR
jgi:hypothetical protein